MGLYQRVMALGEGLQECFAAGHPEAALSLLAERDQLLAAAGDLLARVLPVVAPAGHGFATRTPPANKSRDAVLKLAEAAAEQNRRILCQAKEIRATTVRSLVGLKSRRASVGAYADAAAGCHQARGGRLDRLH